MKNTLQNGRISEVRKNYYKILLNEDYSYNCIARYALYKNLGAENTRNYAKKKEISKWRNAVKKSKRRDF